MDNKRFHTLLEEYVLGRLDKEEARELLSLLDDPEVAGQLEFLVDQQLDAHLYDQNLELPLIRQRIMEGLEATISERGNLRQPLSVHRISFIRRFRWVAAAVFLILAGGIGWMLSNNRLVKSSSSGKMAVMGYKGDVTPGHDGAKLKLSDGRIIVVDTAKDGLIAMDGKVAIYKQNGRIFYKGMNDQVIYNEIVTDKGRQWSATLPDGSVAWLNAMSSLRYPLRFTGTERLVTLKGEGKFKVIHNASMPFRVVISTPSGDGGIVEDLGTEFNINAYNDEKVIKTTVAEGSVFVCTSSLSALNLRGRQGVRLKAGQQAQTDKTGAVKVVDDADIQQAMAWSNGLFSFNGETIETVMRQLARWYDVKVVYEGKTGNMHFGGEISRSQTLAQVLKGLESMNVHFRIEEDKRIVVMP